MSILHRYASAALAAGFLIAVSCDVMAADAVATGNTAAPRHVRVELLTVGMPQETFTALLPDWQDEVKTAALIPKLMEAARRKEMIVTYHAMLTAREGEYANFKQEREVRYPKEYKLPPQPVRQPGAVCGEFYYNMQMMRWKIQVAAEKVTEENRALSRILGYTADRMEDEPTDETTLVTPKSMVTETVTYIPVIPMPTVIPHEPGLPGSPGAKLEGHNVGMILAFKASVREQGKYIEIEVAPKMVRLLGYDDGDGSNPLTVQPKFAGMKMKATIRLHDGQYMLLARRKMEEPEGYVEVYIVSAALLPVE